MYSVLSPCRALVAVGSPGACAFCRLKKKNFRTVVPLGEVVFVSRGPVFTWVPFLSSKVAQGLRGHKVFLAALPGPSFCRGFLFPCCSGLLAFGRWYGWELGFLSRGTFSVWVPVWPLG
jgi:hypothetical protein